MKTNRKILTAALAALLLASCAGNRQTQQIGCYGMAETSRSVLSGAAKSSK